jgi:3-hydroxyisobutyrate dehydrogenase-like beta-hydroxyacid dehydrogenase
LAGLHAVHGSQYVAGPVAGRPDAAAAGKLITFVAGGTEAIERCRTVIEAYATKIILLGTDPKSAQSLKLVVNFFAGSLLELMGQTLVFAEKRGLDTEQVSGMFAELLKHAAMPVYLDKIRRRNFDDDLGFTLDGGLKDIRLILDAAAEVQVPLPYASIVRDKMIAAQAHGMSQRDWSAFTEMARLSAGQGLTAKARRAGG